MIYWFDKESIDIAIKANGSKNCPNCGAPIESEKCPYCETVFIDFACMDADKPFFMKIKRGEDVYILKVKLNNVDMHYDAVDLYIDNLKFLSVQSLGELDLSFEILR